MAAITTALRSDVPNRRRRVRHKIQTPAYATFAADSTAAMLDLHEIVDISEEGVAIQCASPLEAGRSVNLCLDLNECAAPIYTAAQVIWSNAAGRAGLHFSELPATSLFPLREWLFLNAMTGAANAGEAAQAAPVAAEPVRPRPDYTDTLAALTAVQREVEALGPDLAGALQLISTRAQTLLRASGAAIALAGTDPDFMVCCATSGRDAPPSGARLQVGSGFSGECVQTGKLLRCDDAETDSRVDRESCRALGIRSILAAPVCVAGKAIGILEVFSTEPNSFAASDSSVLQRLADAVLPAVNRAARAADLPLPGTPAPAPFPPSPGSVLFASAPEGEQKVEGAKEQEKISSGISLPRSYLILLFCAAATISVALGILLAPWIQSKLQERGRGHLQTVLASSQAPKSETPFAAAPSTPTIEQLQQMAEKGDPVAENALGVRYATGEGVKLDEREAARWFTKAAEQGNVAAQSKLGSLYLSGRGVPQDSNRAYFWMVLARANGDESAKVLAPVATAHLTRAQVTSIELDADRWLQQHQSTAKLDASR